MGYVSETAADLLSLCSFSSGKSHEIPLLWLVPVVFKSRGPILT